MSPRLQADSVKLRFKRAYEPPAAEDGERYLVDRLWPRGLKTETLALTGWLKEVAPSDSLRRWFGHDPARWVKFRRRYQAELKSRAAALQPLRDAEKRGPVTLVYGAKDAHHNHALVLREFLLKMSSSVRKVRAARKRPSPKT